MHEPVIHHAQSGRAAGPTPDNPAYPGPAHTLEYWLPLQTPTAMRFIDHTHPTIAAFTQQHAGDGPARDQAVRLFTAVRDGLRYDPYSISLEPDDHRASSVLASGRGFCVSKAVVLAAVLRAAGFQARVGFADVRNHLTTPKLRALMGSDEFIYHGYTELELEGQLHKLTPAFDRTLCERFGVRTLDWHGEGDALFHPFDAAGRAHMEYLRDHGTRDDLHFEEMMAAYRRHYPLMFDPDRRAQALADHDADRFSAN